MNAPTTTSNPFQRRIVGAMLSLALVLEGLLVPLHLTWYDHVHPGEAPEHAHVRVPHAADGHWHGPEHFDSVEPDSEHRPHPVEDHENRRTECAPAASCAFAAFAAVPAESVHGPAPNDPPQVRVDDADGHPRPPPERATTAPRAPPLVV